MRHATDLAASTGPVLTPSFYKLTLAFFVYVVNLNLFNLVPYFLELRGAEEALYGAVGGMAGLCSFAFIVVLGHLADAQSRKRAILLYLVPVGLSDLLALLLMHQHPAWYLLVTGLQGAMSGLGLPLLFLWAAELAPPARRVDVFAWLGVGGLSADALGPLLGEVVLNLAADPDSARAYAGVFWAGLLCFPITLLLVLATPDAPKPRPDGHQSLLPLLRRRETQLLLAAAVFFGCVFGILLALSKNFVATLGLGYVSVLFATYILGALSSRLTLPRLRRRFAPGTLILCAFAGMGAANLLLALTQGYGLLAFAGLVYGVSHGLMFPTLLGRTIDYQSESERGRASTLMMGFFALGIGVGPTVGGMVLEWVRFPTLYALVACTSWSAILLVLAAERRFRGRPAPTTR